MKFFFTLALAFALTGCAGFSMLPDSSGTKLKKSPCACIFEPIHEQV